MPTYDYRCAGCRHEFELVQKMSDPVKRTCPACGKKALERLIGTGAAIIFKGSGFYQTDYRSEAYKKAAEADKAPGAGGGAEAGGAKADGKTEAKAEGKQENTTAAKPDAKAEGAPSAKSDAAKGEKSAGNGTPAAKAPAVIDAKPAKVGPAKVGSAKVGPAKTAGRSGGKGASRAKR